MKKTITLFAFFCCIYISSSVLAAGMCTKDKDEVYDEYFDQEYDDYTLKIDKLTEVNTKIDDMGTTGALQDVEFAGIEKQVPGITESMHSFGSVGGLALGAGMNSIVLAQAIQSKDAGAIGFSSAFMAKDILGPFVGKLVSEMAGEMVADVVGEGVGFALAEGFSIYIGLKEQVIIDNLKNQDLQLADQYHAQARTIEKSMKLLGQIIQGNSDAAYQYDLQEAGMYLFSANQKSIVHFVDLVASEGFERKSMQLLRSSNNFDQSTYNGIFQDRHLDSLNSLLLSTDISSSSIAGRISEIGTSLRVWNTPQHVVFSSPLAIDPGNVEEVSTYGYLKHVLPGVKPTEPFQYKLTKRYGGSRHLLRSDYLFHLPVYDFYGALMRWYIDVYGPVMEKVVFSAFDDHKRLVQEFIALMKSEEGNTQWQEKMLQRYNQVLETRLAWLWFGQQFLDKVATFDDDEAVWFFRVMSPVLEQFFDSALLKNEISVYGAALPVYNMVHNLVQQRTNIYDIDVTLLMSNYSGNKELETKHALDESITYAKNKVASMKLNNSMIRPIVFNLKPGSPTIIDLENKENKDNYLSKELNKKIHDYIQQILPYNNTTKGNQLRRNFFHELFTAHSRLTGIYYKKAASLFFNTAKSLGPKPSDRDAYLETVKLQSALYNNYISTRRMNPEVSYIPWLKFRSIPFPPHDFQRIDTFLSNVVSRLYEQGKKNGTLVLDQLIASLIPGSQWRYNSTIKAFITVFMGEEDNKAVFACASYDGLNCFSPQHSQDSFDFQNNNPVLCTKGTGNHSATPAWCSTLLLNVQSDKHASVKKAPEMVKSCSVCKSDIKNMDDNNVE